MIFVLIIWISSLLALIASALFAFRKVSGEELQTIPPHDLSEFVRDTIYRSVYHVYHTTDYVKPHVSRVSEVVVGFGKKGHDMFNAHVFGKMSAKKGTASSFFLKHIAEYKEQGKKEGEGKIGY